MAIRIPPFLPHDAPDGRRLWRSLEEWAEAPEVRSWLEAEFPDLAQAGVDRRTWLRLMGASLALAGLSACGGGSPPGDPPLLSPVAHRPGLVAGQPVRIATSLDQDGTGFGVLVKAQDGRPIKVEGNPLHPASLGATSVFAEAEILSLYDPDRSRGPTENGAERSWEECERFLRPLRNEFVVREGRGLHAVLPPLASPSVERLVEAARGLLPHARWYSHAALAEGGRIEGAVRAFGRPVDLVHELTRADVIVCLGGDLFATGPGHVRYAADYQARRRDGARPLPRLVAVESTPGLTGTRADARIALRPRDLEAFARAVLAALDGAAPADAHPEALRVAADLRRAGASGLVVVGREQPAAIHAIGHAVNARLGAFGTTTRAIGPVGPIRSIPDQNGSMVELAETLAAGRAEALLILGANPAYDAPADLDLAALIGRVPLSLHLGTHRDETALACRWHVPQCHALEAFGDLRAHDGTAGLRQPAVTRLAPSLGLEETLSLLVGQAADGRGMLRATWQEVLGEDADSRLAQALEDGVVEGTAFEPLPVTLRDDWDRGTAARPAAALDIVFAPDPSVGDGRHANNAWLQELPKPLTKQVWGNAALIAPETARSLKLATGDVIEIASGGRTLAAPVWVLPGHAPDTLTLPLGYGRWRAGSVGNGVGFDAYRLRHAAHPWIAAGEARPLGRRVELISTQLHHALPSRDIVRVVAPGEGVTPEPAARPSLYPEWPYPGPAWAMAIDLDACIGCNACVVACQAENNIAVVGPDQAARGREMHWLRIDRYYAGPPEAPDTLFQPVLCMHCEKAPCEVVCPVNATVHSSEGLNDMVYNRCIGTRTCSNNCPYKVRRFNFLDTRSTAFATPADAFNPQVTVRDRGVMEKCTYCVHRISAARVEARIEERGIRDGEVVTACQQACPTQAIVFGDANDADSAVARLKRSPRNYALLGDLNTQPRTTYLARIEADGDGT
ncbi:MAG TPA: TAT-variant-translocated molybdopterin oxidoreductase [Microvirga sp.]|jgi:molybdopterin-containing oxidoreductase family iron-sulfur binding subunit|nr:TAT-variant-translocated molybdopterin oxidoreductase [Microvirga sp.]